MTPFPTTGTYTYKTLIINNKYFTTSFVNLGDGDIYSALVGSGITQTKTTTGIYWFYVQSATRLKGNTYMMVGWIQDDVSQDTFSIRTFTGVWKDGTFIASPYTIVSPAPSNVPG